VSGVCLGKQKRPGSGGHLGQAVHVALVDELVVGGVHAALVDAEQIRVGHIWRGRQIKRDE